MGARDKKDATCTLQIASYLAQSVRSVGTDTPYSLHPTLYSLHSTLYTLRQ